MHILSPVTDNCSSWISGRGRMAVEMFSWPSLHERMCRTWGSNSGPLACQANSLPRPTETEKADLFDACSVSFYRYSVSIWAATWQNQQNECAPSEDSDQPGHPPSLIRVFTVRMKKSWVLSYQLSAQRRLWSDWADALAVLSLRWAHTHYVGFVMSRLI